MNTYWNDGTELYHYGIQGMKWGVRRWQNPDGTFNEEGKKRYGRNSSGKLLTQDKFKTNKARASAAAKTGLSALRKMGRDAFDEEWFLYEDQTIGLATIADLVNHGSSKQQILQMVNEAYQNRSNPYDVSTFELAYNYRNPELSDFIDACISSIKK